MAMCTPEIDRMCARPESRIWETSSGDSQASWPVVIATATPPSRGPMSSIIRRASDQRAWFTASLTPSAHGGAGPCTIIGSEREKPTAPTLWK